MPPGGDAAAQVREMLQSPECDELVAAIAAVVRRLANAPEPVSEDAPTAAPSAGQ